MKSVKTLRRTRLRRRVLRRARSRVGAVNKYTFRKVLQIKFSQGFASSKSMYFRKISQICFRRNIFPNMLSQKDFRKYALAISQASRKFASMVSQCFASFRNSCFRKDSQGFARIRKWTFAGIRQGFLSAKIMVFRNFKDSQWALC